jgi:hypothetical protein
MTILAVLMILAVLSLVATAAGCESRDGFDPRRSDRRF